MKSYCRLVPKEGVNLFNNLKEKYGYNVAWDVTLLCTLPEFIDGKTFRKDSEGFPLMEDLVKDNTVQQFIGEKKVIEGLEKNFKSLEDTRDNYSKLVRDANIFNSSKENKKYIALVEEENNKLIVRVHNRTVENEKEASDQYAVDVLNNSLSRILGGVGITIGDLEEAELAAGRVGVTNFNAVMNIATSSVNVIRAANNHEGSKAISEEFSHLVIGAFRDDPLIKRALKAITNKEILRSILGDEYEYVYKFQQGDLELVAEEALGQLLQENLLAAVSNNPEKISKLLDRVYSKIKNIFKGVDDEAIVQAVMFANNIIGQLAADILEGKRKLNKQKVESAKRNAVFNSLSERIDANIKVLEEARKTELKRLQINSNMSKDESDAQKTRISELALYTTPNSGLDTRVGILKYAKQATEDLKIIKNGLEATGVLNNPSFSALRRARSYVQSYAPFITGVYTLLSDAKKDSEVPDYFKEYTLADGTVINIEEVISELNSEVKKLVIEYKKKSLKMITEFFRPYFGNEFKMSMGRDRDTTFNVEDIIEEATKDISFIDLFLTSMADSSDMFLQLFDSVVVASKIKARENTTDESKEIQRLLNIAEENGITEFDWIFEYDKYGNKTGNYISAYNMGNFFLERKEFLEYLDEKYGANPNVENAQKRNKEYTEWLKKNANIEDPNFPGEKYRNEFYEELMSSNSKRKEIYEGIMELKHRMDSRYPSNRTAPYKAIQMRKTLGNRLIESASNIDTLIENIKENLKETFLDNEDDDQLYGDTSLQNFDGTEYMRLPVLYNNPLANPNELSTDVFSSLLAYSYASNVYQEMEKIVDPLEVAKNLVVDKDRKVHENVDGQILVEKIKDGLNIIENKIVKGNSNIERKLTEYMEAAVYQRYMKKSKRKVFGLSSTKVGNWILKQTSLAQLGFNWLANSANVATGLAMTNIEAYAGEFFTGGELRHADGAYLSMLPEFLAELGSRVKTNKMSLFDEMLNIKIDYPDRVKDNMKKNWLEKLFGARIAYLGQTGGDHWLYNRIAIAYCKHKKVFVKNNPDKDVKKVRGLYNAEKALKEIILNSENLKLSDDERFYEDVNTGRKYARVTSVIQAGSDNAFEEIHPDGRPNTWITPSTNIGTGIDELVRDFFDGQLLKAEDGKWHHNSLGDDLEFIYPNAKAEDIHTFLDSLERLKEDFDRKGLTVVSKGISARGKLTVSDGGTMKELDIAGTLDLLVYDKNGDFYIYDMKTHRGNIDSRKRHKWSAQLSLYKRFLEKEYGIRVKSLHIIPIKVSYPIPEGEKVGKYEGKTKYTVKADSNQLLADGKEFKDSKPILEDTLTLNESNIEIEYDSLGYNKKAAKVKNFNDYTEMSLWEAFKIIDVFEDRDDIKKMILPEGTVDEYGEEVDLKKVAREIQDINIHLFGAYNQEDSNVANRYIMGRAIQQYRKWIVPQFNKRFQAAKRNSITGKTTEGYYNTFGKYYAMKFFGGLMGEVLRSKFQIPAHWDELSKEEKANVRRAQFEILQCLCVYLLATYAPWPDDKNRPWALKYAEYIAKREVHELGMLTPSLTMGSEILKTVQTPMAALSTGNNMLALIHSIVTPSDWLDEKQSGPYKGSSSLYANFMRAPLWGVSQYTRIDRFIGNIDNSISFYARPY